MIFIFQTLSVQCGGQHNITSNDLNGTTQFTQTCQSANQKCIYFNYIDLPEMYRNVFQLIDPNDIYTYNLCDIYQNLQSCATYCRKKCKQVQPQQLPMRYNLTMAARHNESVYYQEYTNETAFASFSYQCVELGIFERNSTALIIVILCSAVVLIIILYVSGTVFAIYRQKIFKRKNEEIERIPLAYDPDLIREENEIQ
ncbi:Hypothetical_protein [Hexamita inflata]|uniref:Hypothetical_protein n=1 Tax=Hexamita inflata TaxID=28002 RepID=A0AA86TJU1_9EUKA|nr:Hypothetical protein HINF_LOCUS2793 [Hexamita inflata]